jgi:multiple antibiotic resistance protein
MKEFVFGEVDQVLNWYWYISALGKSVISLFIIVDCFVAIIFYF